MLAVHVLDAITLQGSISTANTAKNSLKRKYVSGQWSIRNVTKFVWAPDKFTRSRYSFISQALLYSVL